RADRQPRRGYRQAHHRAPLRRSRAPKIDAGARHARFGSRCALQSRGANALWPHRRNERLTMIAKSPGSLPLRFALRELRGGLRGFYVFIACIALGSLAIAGVGSTAASLADGLAHEGSVILGGDLAFTLIQREAKPEEMDFLKANGEVSSVATMRA